MVGVLASLCFNTLGCSLAFTGIGWWSEYGKLTKKSWEWHTENDLRVDTNVGLCISFTAYGRPVRPRELVPCFFSLILFLSFLLLTLMNYVHSLKGSSGNRMQLRVHTLTRIVCNPTIVKWHFGWLCSIVHAGVVVCLIRCMRKRSNCRSLFCFSSRVDTALI